MEQETRSVNLNTERAFRYVELAKVYGKKVTFNIRTLILDIPREGKLRRAVRKYKMKAGRSEKFDLSLLSDRAASELVFQYFRFSTMAKVYNRANEKYADYYKTLKKELRKLRGVKSLANWRLSTNRRKTRLYNKARELNSIYHKEYMEDINALLKTRVGAINAKKEKVWEEYLKEPEKFEKGIENYINSGRKKRPLETGE